MWMTPKSTTPSLSMSPTAKEVREPWTAPMMGKNLLRSKREGASGPRFRNQRSGWASDTPETYPGEVMMSTRPSPSMS